MSKILRKEKREINKMIKLGEREVFKAGIMIKFYQWQKDNAPEEATKEELGKLDLKINQLEDVITNNTNMKNAFITFLKS